MNKNRKMRSSSVSIIASVAFAGLQLMPKIEL
jgi:hypothetical protein